MIRGGVRLPSAAPLAPDRDEARQWAERVLSDPAYAAAEPNFIDRIARAVVDFFENLFMTRLSGEWGPAFAVVVAIIVAVLIVAGVLIWGRPRAAARARRAPALFGETEGRTAAELRRDAADAAARDEWDEAIVLRFRALVRGLEERTLVDVAAGTTVHGFARTAALAFPAEAQRMDAAATAFDDVRYLRRPGTDEIYRVVSQLDDDLAGTRPSLVGAP